MVTLLIEVVVMGPGSERDNERIGEGGAWARSKGSTTEVGFGSQEACLFCVVATTRTDGE